MSWGLRLADENDISAIELLIPLSVRALQAPYYSETQIDAALGPVFGVDRQLIKDRTYFVAEEHAQVVACGGWSKRKTLCGSDQGRDSDDGQELDPVRDPARIRAFFVHPGWARQGIGRSLLVACEAALVAAHFHHVELVATLAGEPFYACAGYLAVERYEIMLSGGVTLPVVRMTKRWKAN